MDRLAAQLRQPFDWYVAITRGGLVPACLLAQITGQRQIDTLVVRSYSDERVQEEVHILHRGYGHLRGRSVLLIDDLVDSGRTLDDCTEYLRQEAGASLVETAVIYRKAGSQYQPTYCIEEKPRDEWIVFPWEEKQAI